MSCFPCSGESGSLSGGLEVIRGLKCSPGSVSWLCCDCMEVPGGPVVSGSYIECVGAVPGCSGMCLDCLEIVSVVFGVFRELPEYREWGVGVRGVEGGPWSVR